MAHVLMGAIPTEAQEQETLFDWHKKMTGEYPVLRLMHHIPNGGSRNPVEARNLRMQGVKAGVPDIFLPCARKGYHGLYIELKRQRGGRVSPEQRQMIADLREQGYKVEVCAGFDAAREVIEEYLEA